MTRHSLRFRLFVAAAVSAAAALLIAGISLVLMFEHHVERRIGAELENHIKQIIAGIDMTADGRIAFAKELADPRFSQPLSGLYWQVQDDEQARLLRSRSLWDHVIALPVDELAIGVVHERRLPGPGDDTLLVRERQILFQPGQQEHRIRIAVAINQVSLVAARNAFAVDMLPYLVVVAVVLLAAAWIQVRIGLAPLDRVRRGVMEIRSGSTARLAREYPDEVMPLIDEMNGLLQAQEQAIARARDWTADLAHGLKTPLMVLTTDAQRLRERGDLSMAEDLEQLAETMRRRVDRELVRARVRSSVTTRHARADVGDVIDRIVRTLQRTPLGAPLEWKLASAEGVAAAISGDDLTELLGNVLENATKWAKRTVAVTVTTNESLDIRVEDDGPGVAEDQLATLGQRGLRLDQQKQGTGLGLAIARDVIEAYQGGLSFERSSLGGLAVTLQLPRFR